MLKAFVHEPRRSPATPDTASGLDRDPPCRLQTAQDTYPVQSIYFFINISAPPLALSTGTPLSLSATTEEHVFLYTDKLVVVEPHGIPGELICPVCELESKVACRIFRQATFRFEQLSTDEQHTAAPSGFFPSLIGRSADTGQPVCPASGSVCRSRTSGKQ